MSDICRICLKQQNVMFSIYDKYSDEYNEPICDMIMYCASVKIEKGDGLPDLLCQICKARLGTAYLFKRDCEQSEHKLRKTLRINGVDYRLPVTENVDFNQLHQIQNPNYPVVVLQVTPEIEKYAYQNSVKSEVPDDDDKADVTEDIEQLEFDPATDELTSKEEVLEEDTSSNSALFPADDFVKEESEEDKKFDLNIENVDSKKIHRRIKRKNYYCYACSRMFSTKNGLDTHMSENHRDQKFVCDLKNCTKQFTDWLRYSVHLKIDHSIENFLICQQCQISFRQKNYLDRHIYKKHGDCPYVCEHCSERFQETKALEQHMNIHTEKYKCETCDMCFSSDSVLENHKRTHNTDDSYPCYDCDETFSTKLFLQRHVCKKNRKAEENRKVKNHLCPYCAKRFPRPIALTRHIFIHTGVKPFKCELCDHRCRTKSSLQSHVRTHTGERPFKCSYCEKTFRQKTNCVVHERFHSGHRPYVCSTCQKGFTNSNDLKVHERTHTGIKLFSCEICDDSFTTKHYLGVHKRKHMTK